jgi:hypothetical protein
MKILFKVRYFRYLVLFLLFLGIFIQKANSQNYASDFIKKQKNSKTKDVVYIKSNPTIIIPNQTSALLDSINDSLLVEQYTQKLKETLIYLGFEVLDSTNSFIDQRHHTLNIAQIEIDNYKIKDSLTNSKFKDEVFYKDLNAIRFNVWLIYNEKDTNSSLVFYTFDEVQDFFEGEITKQDTDFFASYDYKEINIEDIYALSAVTGITTGVYFFNYLLNKFVWIQSEGKDNMYYGIDISTKDIISDYSPFDNFDIIEQEE